MGVTWFWNPNCFCDFGLKSRCWYVLCWSRYVWLLYLIRQDFSDHVWLWPCLQIQICPSTQAQVKIRRLSLVPATNIIPTSQIEKVRLREVKQPTSMTTAPLLNGIVKFQICFPLTSKSLYLGSLSSFKDTAFSDQLDRRTQKNVLSIPFHMCLHACVCVYTHARSSLSLSAPTSFLSLLPTMGNPCIFLVWERGAWLG